MEKKYTLLELQKERMKFSAGHFTILSPTTRERLHGHNFTVYAAFRCVLSDDGIRFDYRIYKHLLYDLCARLNEYFLLPTQSPYLKIREEGVHYIAHFHEDDIPFLKKDVLLLPLPNITVEALASWFVDEVTKDAETLQAHGIEHVLIKVFTGPGQSGSSEKNIEVCV